MEPKEICVFLLTYNHYANQIRSHAQKVDYTVRIVKLKVWVDVKTLESFIALKLKIYTISVENLTDKKV